MADKVAANGKSNGDMPTLVVVDQPGSPSKAETKQFLDRRIENVMQFEKAKAQFLGGGPDGEQRESFSPVRLLGRLRYPAR